MVTLQVMGNRTRELLLTMNLAPNWINTTEVRVKGKVARLRFDHESPTTSATKKPARIVAPNRLTVAITPARKGNPRRAYSLSSQKPFISGSNPFLHRGAQYLSCGQAAPPTETDPHIQIPLRSPELRPESQEVEDPIQRTENNRTCGGLDEDSG